MEERIKIIRKELGLTQEEFAKRIGLVRSSVAKYEIGRREPTNAIILSICKEFNIREEWLRTGQGEMFKENPLKDEVGYYIEELLEDYEDNPLYDVILTMMKTYAELDEKSKKVIRDCAKKLQDNLKAQEVRSSRASQDTYNV